MSLEVGESVPPKSAYQAGLLTANLTHCSVTNSRFHLVANSKLHPVANRWLAGPENQAWVLYDPVRRSQKAHPLPPWDSSSENTAASTAHLWVEAPPNHPSRTGAATALTLACQGSTSFTRPTHTAHTGAQVLGSTSDRRKLHPMLAGASGKCVCLSSFWEGRTHNVGQCLNVER